MSTFQDKKRIGELEGELARVKDAAKTLGEMVHMQCDWALDATGLHDVIAEDGDGDWQHVWESLAELRPRAEKAEATIVRAEAAIRLLGNEDITPQGARIIRAALGGA